MSPKVSIIVPIYCVEKYLQECVDSLLRQTLSNIEIILIDDGSPDRCGEIVDLYAKKDNRIKAIHQQNAGLGPARNTGIMAATGEYIGFVDSDDWVKPEMYEKLYKTAIRENADIVVSGHCDVASSTILRTKSHPMAGKTLTSVTDIMQMRKNLYGHSLDDNRVEAFPMSVCMSIYRRTLIENAGILFTRILSEDTIFNLSAYKHARIISFTDGIDYCYRKEGQPSITQVFSDKTLEKFQKFLNLLAQMAGKEADEECIMRVKRTAIDYCRLYVGIVGNSRASLRSKRKYVREFSQKEEICGLWDGYPIECLPFQQRVFHMMIIHKWFGTALILNWFRQKTKKGAQICNACT